MNPGSLRLGHSVWRIERAARAAVLIDGAAFFQAIREAFLKARRSILIVGWDIDSRTQLYGKDGLPSDGYPPGFADFLSDLVRRRPELSIHLLLWDYSLLYAGERELLPRLSLDWQTPDRITLSLDSTVPFGSSQHQKIVVVDDALAFSGGLDLTIRRWDTGDHEVNNPQRVDPAGKPYRPFHDVQMMVDGAAAHALARLARQRWCRVNGGEPMIDPLGDPWPATVATDFTDVDIGIARTQPQYNGDEPAREVEVLFLESIEKARRSIYIENQFLTCPIVARRLAAQLRKHPELEIVLVAPRSHDSWIERRTMRNGRIRFWRLLHDAGGDRVRLLYPSVEQAGKVTDTMIHSKVMIIDDCFLRVGSANLNNRSMGADTECDLAIEATSEKERSAIASVRDRLLGEHCGVSAGEVAAWVIEHRSLVGAADTLAAKGHRLCPIEDGEPDRSFVAKLIERVADPRGPLRLTRIARVLSRVIQPGPRILAVLGFFLAALVLTLAWQFTDLSKIADSEQVRDLLAAAANGPWAFVLVLAVFVVGGAVAFPVTILILATGAVFGPWLGLLYSAIGALAGALAMYFVGARFGQEALGGLLGRRWKHVLDRVRDRGLLAVVALRALPVAPFTLVNLAAGASAIRLSDFILGTLIGMAPGLVAMAVLGDRLMNLLADHSAGEIALLALCVALWIGLSFGVQALLSRGERGTRHEAG